MNSQPIFVEFPQRNFLVAINQTLFVELPATVDPEGNAAAEILFEPLVGYEDLYPPFMTTYQGNRSFSFNVTDEAYAGKQYFFKIILKEEGVNTIGYPYYYQVEVEPLQIIDDEGGTETS